MKKQILPFLLLISYFLLLPPVTIHAQATQFYLEDSLGSGMTARVYLIGQAEAKTPVQEALYAAIDHARASLEKIQDEIAAINQQKSKENTMVSPELAKALHAGLELSEKTGGQFDITAGNFKKMKVNLKNNSVKILGENIQIDLAPILKGVLADLIAEDLAKAGWPNLLIKIENVYVTRGNDANAPWRIPVVVPSQKIAKRVLYYKTKKERAAGATWSPSEATSSNLQSVTIFSQSGANAEGLSSTVYRMGMEGGKAFLAKNKSLSAIFVDTQGNLTNVP